MHGCFKLVSPFRLSFIAAFEYVILKECWVCLPELEGLDLPDSAELGKGGSAVTPDE